MDPEGIAWLNEVTDADFAAFMAELEYNQLEAERALQWFDVLDEQH